MSEAAPKIEVIYFKDCPNAAPLVATLRRNGIPFESVIQDALPDTDDRSNLSSPSVLIDGIQILGSKVSPGSSGCTWADFSEEAVMETIREAIAQK